MRYILGLFFLFNVSFSATEIINNVSYNIKTKFKTEDENLDISQFQELIEKNLKLVNRINVNREYLRNEYLLTCTVSRHTDYAVDCELENFFVSDTTWKKQFTGTDLVKISGNIAKNVVKEVREINVDFNAKLGFIEYKKANKFNSCFIVSDIHGINRETYFCENAYIFRPVLNQKDKHIYYNTLDEKGKLKLKRFSLTTRRLSDFKILGFQNKKVLSIAFSNEYDSVAFTTMPEDNDNAPLFIVRDEKIIKVEKRYINSTPIFLNNNTLIYATNSKGKPRLVKNEFSKFFGFGYATNLVSKSFPTGMFEPAMHANSKLITFTTVEDANFSLIMYDMQDEDLKFIDSGFMIERSDWSADGFFIAYGFQELKNTNSVIKIYPYHGLGHFKFTTISSANNLSYPIFL